MKEMRGTALDQAINCYYESNRLVKMLQAYLEYHSKHSTTNKVEYNHRSPRAYNNILMFYKNVLVKFH